MRAGSFKRLLGSTRPERGLKTPPEALELTRRIRRPFGCTRIDWPPLKLITDIAWEEMDMKVGGRIAMNFVIHLDRLDYRRHGGRNSTYVPHEGCPLGLGQVMQLDYVAAEDQARVAAHRVVGAE